MEADIDQLVVVDIEHGSMLIDRRNNKNSPPGIGAILRNVK
jgi:hypothetical protein